MNDVFDVLNGRSASQGINKDSWEDKKTILVETLGVIDRKETIHKNLIKNKRKTKKKTLSCQPTCSALIQL